jgi:hypothetical protein
MSSIFSKDPSGEGRPSPRESIREEITHLDKLGRSRWKTTPLAAFCRSFGMFLFLVMVVLYFLDPFLLAINKTHTVSAYLYLALFGNEEQLVKIQQSGMFTPEQLETLKLRAQTTSPSTVKDYFLGTAEAEKTAANAIAYLDEVNALHRGELGNVSRLTLLRYYLFRQWGIVPPREWLALDPVLGNG